MKKLTIRTAIALAASAITANAVANMDPAPIDLGGMTLTPTLNTTFGHNDNIRESGINDESSWVTTINPNFLLEAMDGVNVYQVEYGLRQDIFHSSHSDNNLDHHLRGMSHFEIDNRNRITLNATYDRTETLSDTTYVDVNDKFNSLYLEGIYGFGVPSAMFNFDVGLNHQRRRTHNSGGINDHLEYDKNGFIGTGYYNVGARTRLLAEYIYDEYEYKTDLASVGNLDNDRDRFYVGATWAATARTTGSVRLGYENRDFDNYNKEDGDGFSWAADVTWSPRTYSTLTLSSSRTREEARVFSNFVDTKQAGINWNHDWGSNVTSDVFYNWIEEDFDNTASLDREDEINELGMEVRYTVQRWMSVGLGYRYKDRESNALVRDYDRNMFTLNLNVSL